MPVNALWGMDIAMSGLSTSLICLLHSHFATVALILWGLIPGESVLVGSLEVKKGIRALCWVIMLAMVIMGQSGGKLTEMVEGLRFFHLSVINL